MAVKNKGNKYFRGGRYQKAIECYTKALEHCPEERTQDLATFYQNRAAAYDQLVRSSFAPFARTVLLYWLWANSLLIL